MEIQLILAFKKNCMERREIIIYISESNIYYEKQEQNKIRQTHGLCLTLD